MAVSHALALAARGHTVRIVTSDIMVKGVSVRPTFEALDPTIDARWVHARTFRRWPGTVGPVISRSREALASALHDVDVVHCHEWPHGLIQSARRLANRRRVPCLIQPHGSIQVRRGVPGALHRFADVLHPLNSSDIVIVGSDHEESEVVRLARRRPVLHRLVNPMSLSSVRKDSIEVQTRRRSWGIGPGEHVLLYAHRLAPNKGLDLAIEALARLPDEFRLVIVGDDSVFPAFVKSCKALIERLGVSRRVVFGGAVARTEIDETLLAGDTFLLPARRDTFPLMVLHALACGMPTVVTDTCQSVDQLADAVVAVRPTAEAIAEGIRSLDEARRNELSQQARDIVVRRFSPDAVAVQLEAFYHLAREHVGARRAV